MHALTSVLCVSVWPSMHCISHSITVIFSSLSLFHRSLLLYICRVCVCLCVYAWMSHHWCRRSSIFLKFAQISSSYSQCSRRTLNYVIHTLVQTFNWLILCLYWDNDIFSPLSLNLTLTKTFLHFHMLRKALFRIVIKTFSSWFQVLLCLRDVSCHWNKPLTATATSRIHLRSDQRYWQWN